MSIDGSHIDTRQTGVSVAFQDHGRKTRKTYLSTNKEVFDTELYTVGVTLEITLSGRLIGLQ